jgi:hypothetical protein
MIRKLINAIRAALLFTRALDRASKGHYEDGLAYLAEVEKLQIKHFEFDLLGGVLANRTGRHQLALALCRRAKDGIQRERRLNQATRDYLLCFVAYCAEESSRLMEPNLTIGPAALPDCSHVSLVQVPKRIRRNFPLIEHPDWDGSLNARTAASA